VATAIDTFQTLGTAYFPTYAVDVVGIYDENFNQVAKKARTIKLHVKNESKVMDHPVEDGSTISDYTVFLPIEVELTLILFGLDYRDTYNSIIQIYQNRELLNIQTFAGTYNNMIIYDPSHDEGSEIYNSVAMVLKLRQVQSVTPQFSLAPKNKRNKSTVDKGTQQPQPIKDGSSTLVRRYDAVVKNRDS
jgi:hypothetical protein